MKYLLLIFLACSCVSAKYQAANPEHFELQHGNVYHVRSDGRSWKLNEADLRALKIDSLTIYTQLYKLNSAAK